MRGLVSRMWVRNLCGFALGVASVASSVGAQSATVSISQARVLPGATKPSSAATASVRRIPAVGTCGTSRVCAPAWDLRLVGLTLDDTVIAPTGQAVARMTVENRGKVASEASELRLCIASAAQCVGEAAEVTLPPLQSGERVEIVQPIKSYAGTDVPPPFTALVRIDPDRVTSETARGNNDASIKVRVEPPLLAIEAVDVVPVVQNHASQIPVNVIIRNGSSVAAAAAGTIQLSGDCGGSRWGDQATRVAVPALGPGERWSASVAVRHSVAVTNVQKFDMPCSLSVGLSTTADPAGQQSRVARNYVVKP